MKYLNRPPFLSTCQVDSAYRDMEITFHMSSETDCKCHPDYCQCWVARHKDNPNSICGVDSWEDVVEFHKRAMQK
jgi:hypothetical protein